MILFSLLHYYLGGKEEKKNNKPNAEYIYIVKCFNAASECSTLSVVYNTLKIITVCWE